MKRSGRFLLFAPPLPPFPLPRKQPTVIGRGASCDLVIASPSASRRHAEVLVRERGCTVRDLGSTNGTLVNGTPISATQPLTPGDVIQIGDQHITFCHLEDQSPDLPAGDERTVIAVTTATELLRGDLSHFPPVALLQMLELERKTGVLEIGTDGKARLWVEQGRPVHAETEARSGLEAALEIAMLRSGRFVLASQPPAPTRTIDLPMMELVLEASRRFDEHDG